MDRRPARASGGRLLRLRHGVPDRACHGARGGTARGARARGLGRKRARPHRRPGRPRGCERGAPHDGRPGAALPRPWHRMRGAGRDGRPGPHARGRAAGDPSQARGADDRLRPGRERQHGLVRPARGNRGRRRRRRCLAARRRCIRALGRRLAFPSPPGIRRRACRLLGNRRPQVAERALRQRRRLLRPSRRASRRDGRARELPDPRRSGRAARPDGLEPGVLAPRTRLRGVRGDPLARPQRHRRDRGALLRPRPPLRRDARGRTARRGAQRCRAEPGAGAVRGRRRHDAGGHRGRTARRHLLARRHDLEGQGRDEDLGQQLVDDRGGRRPLGRCDHRIHCARKYHWYHDSRWSSGFTRSPR